MRNPILSTCWLLLLGSAAFAQQSGTPAAADIPADFPVHIAIDATKTKGELTPIWRFFGYDEANYTYMKDGKKLLSELGQLGGPQVFIRCHHLLTSGNGAPALKWSSTNAYTEDAQGNPVYDYVPLVRTQNGLMTNVELTLPRQGVSLLVFAWK